MKFFIVEWWDAAQSRYHQEYFKNASMAFERFMTLLQDVEDSNPEIETKHFEDA